MRTAPSANLDFLRAFAVLLVLCQHLCRRMNLNHIGWVATTSLGLFGVLLFFVHTSLVLTQSMERRALSGWPLFRDFYIRRVFRIYPLSVVAVLTALILRLDSDINGVAGLSRGILPGKLSIVSHFLLVQNLFKVKSMVNVLWSLPYEVQMYIVLPLLFVSIGIGRRLRLLLVIWFGSLALALIQPQIALLSRLSILIFVPNFLAGVVAFVTPRTQRISAQLWPILITGLAVVFTLRPARMTGWLLCLSLGFLIPQFKDLSSPWLRMLTHRIATYSYGIYLSHQFSIWIALGALQTHALWLKLLILFVLLVSLPVILYHCIEEPLIKLGANLASRASREPKVEVRAAAFAA